MLSKHWKILKRKQFSKLYHYYLRKAGGQWPITLLQFLFNLAITLVLTKFLNFIIENYLGIGELGKKTDLKQFLQQLNLICLISFFSLFLNFNFLSSIVFRLTSGQAGKFKLIRKPFVKKDITEDIRALNLVPKATREEMIAAKYAVVASYFFVADFLLNLYSALFILCNFNTSVFFVSIFFLTSFFIFSLVKFVFLCPSLFLAYELFSDPISLFALYLVKIIIGTSMWAFVKIFPGYYFFLPLLFVFLSGLLALVFHKVYCHFFLNKDLL